MLGAVVVLAPDGRRATLWCGPSVAFQRLSERRICAYLDSGEWMGKAGGSASRGRAAVFVSALNGSYSNVVGLPLHESVSFSAGSASRSIERMRQILIEHGFGETRLALIERDRLIEFRLSRGEDRYRPGAFHLGRVISVDPALEVAFVEIGAERAGLLPLRDAGKKPPSSGDTVLVQVTRAPIENKGVRLSARLALPGRGIVAAGTAWSRIRA